MASAKQRMIGNSTTSQTIFAPLETAAFKNEKFNELFSALEELLKRIADTERS